MKTKETSKIKKWYQRKNQLSTREQALAWWNIQHNSAKIYLEDKYFGFRNIESLTGKEIEEIWKKETRGEKIIDDLSLLKEFDKKYPLKDNLKEGQFWMKKNKKQFKNFDASLFKAYINKFSEEDKITAFEILFENCKKWDGINNASPFYMSICRAYNAGKRSIISQKIAKDEGNNPNKSFVSSDTYFKKEFGFE